MATSTDTATPALAWPTDNTSLNEPCTLVRS